MLTTKIESILFISNKPLTASKLAELVDGPEPEVEEALKSLTEKYSADDSGIKLMTNGAKYQLVTAQASAEAVNKFVKDEIVGDLTRPQLETLTIVAYRGPIKKSELEQIRGVNCTLILRNLLMRGLVEGTGDLGELTSEFSLTLDFLRHLGISSSKDLPDFENLSRDSKIDELLGEQQGPN
jgi:segregation and condensation protein B